MPQFETAIFRIVQEALTNVYRHSQATRSSVTLLRHSQGIKLAILDNGKGLNEGIIRFRPGSIGVGLGGMRQRVEELSGELHLADAKPGTLVEVIIPVTEQAREYELATA